MRLSRLDRRQVLHFHSRGILPDAIARHFNVREVTVRRILVNEVVQQCTKCLGPLEKPKVKNVRPFVCLKCQRQRARDHSKKFREKEKISKKTLA